MPSLRPRLLTPTPDLHDSWLRARDEFGRGVHLDGSGLGPDDEVDSPAGFAAWVGRLLVQGDETVPVAEGRVHADYWWIVDESATESLGAITLRRELNDFLLNAGGHIGYSVRPSARRQGLASWALGEVLDVARKRGMGRVLVTCKDDNVASARTIEGAGGRLEDKRDTDLGLTRRYWIEL
ncbi:MAG: GNAT family N-acetyltransferase [Actinomycetes bacterium]